MLSFSKTLLSVEPVHRPNTPIVPRVGERDVTPLSLRVAGVLVVAGVVALALTTFYRARHL